MLLSQAPSKSLDLGGVIDTTIVFASPLVKVFMPPGTAAYALTVLWAFKACTIYFVRRTSCRSHPILSPFTGDIIPYFIFAVNNVLWLL